MDSGYTALLSDPHLLGKLGCGGPIQAEEVVTFKGVTGLT